MCIGHRSALCVKRLNRAFFVKRLNRAGCVGYRAAVEEVLEAGEAQLEVVALHIQLVPIRILLVVTLC